MRNRIQYAGCEFTTTDIGSINMRLATSLLSTSLEANVFTAIVKSSDTSLAKFKQNTPLVYFHRDRQRCITYIQSVSRVGAKRYRLQGISAVGLLIQRPHTGGIYTGETVEEVVSEICGGSISFHIKSNLRKVRLYGWLPYVKPPQSSARDNLAKVLFAIGAAVKTDLDGVIRIEGLWDGVNNTISDERIFKAPSVSYGAAVSKAIVTEHQFIKGAEDVVLYEGSAQPDEPIIFSEPMHSLSATGFSIRESSANHAVLSAGTGTLMGKKYVHNTRQITRSITGATTENVKTFQDNALISITNSVAVADRVAAFYGCTATVQNDVVLEMQAPGDVVNTIHPYDGGVIQACIQSLEVTSGASILRATAEEIIGFRPTPIEDYQYFDISQLITTSGTFTVPANVTTLTAVLIGGGRGGWSGQKGQPGTQGGETTRYGSWRFIGYGKGGAGGLAGEGGEGGKILVVTIQVTPGQVIPVTIGAGGVGGTPKESGTTQGSEGGATTFGAYTSANGGVLTSGYQDPITGKVYGVAGNKGIDGGAGPGSTENQGVFTEQWAATSVTGPAGTFTSGALNTDYNYDNGGAISDAVAVSGNSLGGGPAYGANGANGPGPSTAYANLNSDRTQLTVYARAPKGADGAAAALPGFDNTTPGCGGHGGHGGGGGGGEGLAEAGYHSGEVSVSYSVEHASSQGQGGLGSRGGTGAPGCVLLYMRSEVKVAAGSVMTSDNKGFLDKLGRRFIV